MIIGDPTKFAIMYEIIEPSKNNDYWQFGPFNFFINDLILPGIGSNYTIPLAANYLKDSLNEIEKSESIDISSCLNTQEIIRHIAHSHGIYLDSDDDNLQLSNNIKKMGVDLLFYEFTDIGFYMFYYQTIDCDNEFIIYTCDRGKTAFVNSFEKGTIFNVIRELPFNK